MIKLNYETTLGYTNKMKQVQSVKVNSTLNKLSRYDGVTMTEKEFVMNQLVNGATLELKENHSFVMRNGNMSKPKNDYRIMLESGFYTITKTAFDFGQYLVSKKLVSTDVVIQYLADEKAKNERHQIEKENREAEKQAKINAEREQMKQNQNEKQEVVLAEKRKAWANNSCLLLTTEQIEEIKALAATTILQFDKNATIEHATRWVESQNYIEKLGNEAYTLNHIKVLQEKELDKVLSNPFYFVEWRIYELLGITTLNNAKQFYEPLKEVI